MKNTVLRKTTSVAFSIVFTIMTLLPSMAQAQAIAMALPAPGTMVNVTPAFTPSVLKGIKIYPDNPLMFDFLIDEGDQIFDDYERKEEFQRLVNYFMAALTTPEEDMWVNLSPLENDRIVPDSFGKTEMGRDLLAQDYILKQLTASLIYPEGDVGKSFWNEVYQKAFEQYGTTEIPVNTFNKVWITPHEATVYEQSTTAMVGENRLQVLLESDYKALKHNFEQGGFGLDTMSSGEATGLNDISSQVVRDIVLPAIEKEVNEGDNFKKLRQIYHSMILAAWFKKRLENSIVNKIYVDQKKVNGIELDDPAAKDKIYNQYIDAYKKGVYNFIKEEYDPFMQQEIPRKYFSGGWETANSAIAQNNLDVRPMDGSMLSQFIGNLKLTEIVVGVSIAGSALGGNVEVQALDQVAPVIEQSVDDNALVSTSNTDIQNLLKDIQAKKFSSSFQWEEGEEISPSDARLLANALLANMSESQRRNYNATTGKGSVRIKGVAGVGITDTLAQIEEGLPQLETQDLQEMVMNVVEEQLIFNETIEGSDQFDVSLKDGAMNVDALQESLSELDRQSGVLSSATAKPEREDIERMKDVLRNAPASYDYKGVQGFTSTKRINTDVKDWTSGEFVPGDRELMNDLDSVSDALKNRYSTKSEFVERIDQADGNAEREGYKTRSRGLITYDFRDFEHQTSWYLKNQQHRALLLTIEAHRGVETDGKEERAAVMTMAILADDIGENDVPALLAAMQEMDENEIFWGRVGKAYLNQTMEKNDLNQDNPILGGFYGPVNMQNESSILEANVAMNRDESAIEKARVAVSAPQVQEKTLKTSDRSIDFSLPANQPTTVTIDGFQYQFRLNAAGTQLSVTSTEESIDGGAIDVGSTADINSINDQYPINVAMFNVESAANNTARVTLTFNGADYQEMKVRVGDKAQVIDSVGGIDMNRAFLDLNTEGDNAISVMTPEQLKYLETTPIEGLIPNIISITPGTMQTLPFFSELKNDFPQTEAMVSEHISLGESVG